MVFKMISYFQIFPNSENLSQHPPSIEAPLSEQVKESVNEILLKGIEDVVDDFSIVVANDLNEESGTVFVTT